MVIKTTPNPLRLQFAYMQWLGRIEKFLKWKRIALDLPTSSPWRYSSHKNFMHAFFLYARQERVMAATIVEGVSLSLFFFFFFSSLKASLTFLR